MHEKRKIDVNERDELKTLFEKVESTHWKDSEFKSNFINYAVTEETGTLIPLTDE